MGSEWKELSLGEIAENASRPFDFSGRESVVFINTGDVLEGNFLHSNRSTPKGLPGQAKKKVVKGDILFSEIRPANGRYAEVTFEADDYVVSTKFMVIRLTSQEVYQPFFLIQLTSEQTLREFQRIAESRSGTFPQITFDAISYYTFNFPPLPEQKAIAHILGSLDDKIELNRRMNATLEGMAQALFKSWFVDFDPVIDNALEAGNSIPDELAERAKIRRKVLANGAANREIAKQFPASFQHTEELGWIPEGWEVKELGAITTELRRGISPKYIENDGVRVINQRCIRDHTIIYSNARLNDITKKRVDGRYLKTGDMLINSTGVGTLGRMAQVLNLDEPTVMDSHVTVVRSDPAHYMPYVFGRMMISIESQVEAMGHGSTGQTELSRDDLSVTPVIVPTLSMQGHAEELLFEWAIKSEKNSSQNVSLSNLRDILLPKLISGELRIPEVEKLVEEVQV